MIHTSVAIRAMLAFAPGGEEDDSFAILSGAAGESSGLKGFALPPEGYEAVIGDRGEDTGYRREIATGEIVTLADEYDEEDAAILSAPRAVDGEDLTAIAISTASPTPVGERTK